MPKTIYPLTQVVEVKKRRVEDAEKAVKEKRQALTQEEEKLKQCEVARDHVLNHHAAKLQQLRNELDQGTTSPKIQQMKAYLKVVKEKLKVEEKKVQDQKEQVKIAEKNLEEAKENLKKKRQEVDKILTHKDDWEKEVRKEEAIIEAREQDEIGNIIFLGNKRRNLN